MEIPWTHIIWLTVAVSVYLFGIWEGRGQGRKRRMAEEEEEKKNQPPQPETIKIDDPGVLRIKNENGTLSLDLDGEHVNSTMLSSDQRKRLVEILNLIRPMLEGKPAPAIPPPPPPAEDPLSRLDSISASRPAVPAPASPPPAPTPARASSDKNKPTKSGKGKKDDEPEAAPTSMVGQINAILQLRIANTPLASQGVTMIESLSGGVTVYVGLNKYEGVEDVPSEEVKAAIRAAIAEWEKKYTPGL